MDMNEVLDKLDGLLYDVGRLQPNGPFSYDEDKYRFGFGEARQEAYGLINMVKYYIKNKMEKEGK